MPWLDMKAEMERLSLPLYTMESKDPLTAFDAVGFTLQYELSYTNILAMLDLAGIPFYSKDRDESWPLIVAGGPCACNSEPIADFFDVVQLGEAKTSCPASAPKSKRPRKRAASPRKSCCSASPGSPASISRLSTTSNTTRMAASSPSPPTSRASRRSSPRPSSRT